MSLPRNPETTEIPPLTSLYFELSGARELLSIPKFIPGRKYKIRPVAKASVVLITACAESFFEQLARYASRAIHNAAGCPNVLKDILVPYQQAKIQQFHNPTSKNIDSLFQATIGLPRLSSHWPKTKIDGIPLKQKYDEFVGLRHQIAHTSYFSVDLAIGRAKKYIEVVTLISKASVVAVQNHIRPVTGKTPWDIE